MAGALVKECNGWNGMWTLIRILDTCEAGGLTQGSVTQAFLSLCTIYEVN
jgi:hypothetical protein